MLAQLHELAHSLIQHSTRAACCLCSGTVGYAHPISFIPGHAGAADDVWAILAMSNAPVDPSAQKLMQAF